MAPSSPYLRRDEYIDSRNVQDSLINNEFHSLRHSIDLVKDELKEQSKSVKQEFKSIKQEFKSVKQEFKSVNQQIKSVNQQINDLNLSFRQTAAALKNSNLRNLAMRINPVVSLDSDLKIVSPVLELFPKSAKDFFSLRHCETKRQKDMLGYLITFYDLPYTTWRPPPASDDDDIAAAGHDSTQEMTVEEAIHYHSDLAMDLLEGILGLDPANFDLEQTVAEILRQIMLPAKRPHDAHDTHKPEDNPATARRKRPGPIIGRAPPRDTRPLPHDVRPFPSDLRSRPLDLRLLLDEETDEDVKQGDDRSLTPNVMWRDHKGSSLSRHFRDLANKEEGSSASGTTTNPLTVPLSQGRPPTDS